MTTIKRLMIDETEFDQGLIDKLESAIDEINTNLGLALSWAEETQSLAPPQIAWTDWMLEGVLIRLNQDSEIPAAYVDVVMPTTEFCINVCEIIENHIAIYKLESLLANAQHQLHSNPSWLIRLGLVWIGDESDEVITLVKDALEAGNKETRLAAIFVVYFLQWFNFKPILQQALKDETDETLRERLESTLSLIS